MLTETMLLLIYDFILVKMIAPPGLPGNGRAGLSVPTHARNLGGGVGGECGQPACDPDPSPQQPSWHVWGRVSANGTHLGIRSLDPSSARAPATAKASAGSLRSP